jgi:hypothetical protein
MVAEQGSDTSSGRAGPPTHTQMEGEPRFTHQSFSRRLNGGSVYAYRWSTVDAVPGLVKIEEL